MSAAQDEVRRLARAFLPRSPEVSARVTAHVLQAVPELAPAGTSDGVALVRESTDQNIGAMISTLAFGITPTTIEPPEGTHELLANLTAGGGDVTHLLRAYRVGHQLLWRLWSEHVHAEIGPREAPAERASTPREAPAERASTPREAPAERASVPSAPLADVLAISSAHLFDFIDRACERIVSATVRPAGPSGIPGFAGFPGLPGTTPVPDRHELVRRLLGSEPVDLPAAGAALGYDLGRHHVAVLAGPLTETADVRGQLDAVLTAGAAARPGSTAAPGTGAVAALALPAGDGRWWAWLGFPTPPPSDRLDALAGIGLDGVLAGLGEPHRGRDGFRRSLTQAREAERVGRLAPRPSGGVVRHRDVEIAALLCADPDRARRLAADRLGPLAARDDTAARLRETLRAVLAHGHNRGRAAEALHVHHKTVAYRIAQAEQLLGRPLTDDPLALHTALLIDHTLHGP